MTEHITERLEEEAALLLLGRDEHLHPEATENLLRAITLGLITLESAEAERKYIDQSVKAGRQMMTFVGAVA